MPLRTQKLDSPEFRALFTPQLDYVRRLFADEGYEMRIAGGAVRDLLMGIAPADVDFATTATPTQMKELFEREGVRMLHMRGEEHGTVTIRVADAENFEITTLRVDKVCDGRRAEVAFTTDWGLDAERRDLTVNSLFLDLDGTVYDYFDGIRDCDERRVAFVKDPVQRIQEDYLRIFRYFRFFGRIAVEGAVHEPATLKAIADNVGGIRNVSGERVWSELKRIAVGRQAGPVLRVMIEEAGLGPQMALPEKPNLAELERVWAEAAETRTEWAAPTVLAALFRAPSEVGDFARRLRISRLERSLLDFVLAHRGLSREADARKRLQDLFLDTEKSMNQKDEARRHVCQLIRYDGGGTELLRHMETWEPPPFPLSGRDVIEFGVRKGPDVSTAMAHLFKLWKSLDYTQDRQQLLPSLADVVQLNPNPPKLPKLSTT